MTEVATNISGKLLSETGLRQPTGSGGMLLDFQEAVRITTPFALRGPTVPHLVDPDGSKPTAATFAAGEPNAMTLSLG